MSKVAIYCRVSSEEQAREGLSIDAQQARCEAYCKARGWDVYKIYTDAGISAFTVERPALQSLLSAMNSKHFDIVLVYKIDRISRRLKDLIMLLEDFKSKGVNFTSVTEQIDTTSAMGEAFFQVIGVFAQLERALVVERVKMTFDRKTDKGESVSRAPLGYKYLNSQLVVDDATKDRVVEIFDLRLNGVDCKSIALKFGLSLPTVYNILKNPVYIGKLRYKRQLFAGGHVPIVSVEVWDAVNRK